MKILSNPISALNVRESPKYSRFSGNLGLDWWQNFKFLL